MSTPLTHAVQQVEEFVARDGWDQTPRMFALAWASELVSTEPDLAEELGISPTDAGFVPIEQDWTDEEQPLDALLAAIGWPADWMPHRANSPMRHSSTPTIKTFACQSGSCEEAIAFVVCEFVNQMAQRLSPKDPN